MNHIFIVFFVISALSVINQMASRKCLTKDFSKNQNKSKNIDLMTISV
jgi:hypothetical protein